MDTDGDGRLSQAEFLGYAVCKLGALSDDEVRLYFPLLRLYLTNSPTVFFSYVGACHTRLVSSHRQKRIRYHY